MPVTVRGTLTKADLVTAIRYVIWRRSPVLKVMCAIACLIAIAGFASLFFGMGVAALPPIVLSLLYLFFLYRLPAMSADKQWKTFGHYAEEGEYEFADEHFRVSWTSLEVSWLWTSIESTVELPDEFLIFPAKTTVHPVPKRFFTEEQLATVREKLTKD